MSNPKKFFHDRFVLLMLTVNVFLTIVCVAAILLRLGNTSETYIQSFRSNLGLSAYRPGGAGQILSFGAFSIFVLIGQFFIALRLHAVRAHAAWVIMSLAALLLILSLIVSSALLQLH